MDDYTENIAINEEAAMLVDHECQLARITKAVWIKTTGKIITKQGLTGRSIDERVNGDKELGKDKYGLSMTGGGAGKAEAALWARTTKNTDWSTGPLARPFAHSLAPLTRLLALHFSLMGQ